MSLADHGAKEVSSEQDRHADVKGHGDRSGPENAAAEGLKYAARTVTDEIEPSAHATPAKPIIQRSPLLPAAAGAHA
jgi:hypothetical protein